jgi:putative transposase
MTIPSRSSRPGTFFITTATYNRRRLFQSSVNADLFLETLQYYRRAGYYKLHPFVVMPDHVHLILTPQVISLERAVGFIKGAFRIVSPRSFQFGNEASRIIAFVMLRIWRRGARIFT